MGLFDKTPVSEGTPESEIRGRVEAARKDGEQIGRREATREAEKRIAELVMRAYDLTEKYPDESEEKTGTRPSNWGYVYGFSETYTYTVETPGWGKLIADLEAVVNARDVEAAAARLGVSR
jgi:hypothetical protein